MSYTILRKYSMSIHKIEYHKRTKNFLFFPTFFVYLFNNFAKKYGYLKFFKIPQISNQFLF